MNYGIIISKANNQKLLVYKQFGSYSGDWIAITKNDTKYYIYKGVYGSCSGCDSLESFLADNNFDYFNDDENFFTIEKIKEFSSKYPVFIEVDKNIFISLLKEKSFLKILPRNTRLDYEFDDNDIFKELEKEILEFND